MYDYLHVCTGLGVAVSISLLLMTLNVIVIIKDGDTRVLEMI